MSEISKIPYHLLSTSQVLKKTETVLSTGLTSEEAQNRFLIHGPNVLPSKESKTFLDKLWEQVNSAIFYILIIGGALSFGFDHIADGVVIVCVIVLNVFLGIFMEGRAENSTKNLSSMMSVKAVVRRDDEKKEIKAEELTYGDLIYLSPGDVVPADSRVLECADLEVLEAPLTGESHPISKTTDLSIISKESEVIGKILRENSLAGGNFHLPDDDSTQTRPRGSSINRSASVMSKSALAIETHQNLSELSYQTHNPELKQYCHDHELELETVNHQELDIEAQADQYTDTDIPLAERTTMVYSGTQVIKGSALCAVVGIGSNCEMGKISSLLNLTKETKTPLLVELDKMGRIVSIAIIIIAIASLGAAIGRDYDISDAFSIAVGVAVAAIPEGLPSCVTITFAIGVSIMANKGAIIKTLPAVETLGSVSVICSDKTGTLTLNKMSVTEVMTGDNQVKLSNDGDVVSTISLRPDGQNLTVLNTLIAGILCNDSSINSGEEGEEFFVQGEPTEKCILELACKIKSPEEIRQLIKSYPRSEVVPFDSSKKFMGTLHQLAAKDLINLLGFHPVGVSESVDSDKILNVIFIKGASEKIIKFTQKEEDVPVWEDRIISLAAQGLRVLGTAYKIVPEGTVLSQELEEPTGFQLLSLLGIIDPPRPEAITAVKVAQGAGITVKMITGDHPVTALAIGKQLGLRIDSHTQAIVGSTLDKLLEISDLEFDKIVLKNDVFARTSPEHKLKIVQSLQRQGIVCSMTGDGVNDAPALKAANIGVAMGIMGTEVAKDAANMILTDDNFSTIIEAIRRGRCTYNNLIKILIYVFPTNGAQSFSILMALAIGLDVPITALQILWVNMVTTICLGLIFAFEEPNKDIMKFPPRRPDKPIFGKFLTWRVLYVTAIMVCSVIGNFQWEKRRDLSDSQLYSVAVNTLFSCQFFYIFNCRNLKRNDYPLKYVTGNKWVWIGILVTTGLQMIFTYAYPLQYVFKTGAIDGTSWGKIILFGVCTFIMVEIEKMLNTLRLKYWSKEKKEDQAFEEL